jgi:FtsH-binding integral membrane protein
MIRKSRIYSITAGGIALALGLFALVSTLAGLSGSDVEGLLLAIAALFLICGGFGLAGGLLLRARLKLARVLLLVAAIAGLPLGLVFYFIFMYARKGTLRLLKDDAFRSTNIGAAP